MGKGTLAFRRVGFGVDLKCVDILEIFIVEYVIGLSHGLQKPINLGVGKFKL